VRRANGEGSVEVLPSGKARLSFQQDGRRRRKLFASEALAVRALAALELLREDGTIDHVNGRTFGEAFDAFMTARELSGRVRGIDEEKHLAAARVRPAPFFGTPIRSIRRGELVDWIDELLSSRAIQTVRTGGAVLRRETDRTLSRSTVCNAVRLVRQCFDHALARELVDANPLRGVKVPRHVRDEDCDDAWTHLSADEIATLVSAELSERDRALFTLAIYAGPREGELFALRWDDVHEGDDERPRFVIRRTRRGPTKSGKVREVPLLAPARAALARWRDLSGGTKAAGLVFPAPHGGMYGKGYDGGWADKRQRRGTKRKDGRRELVVALGVKSRAGIARDVRFHDLRHTCASHLVMGTWGATWTLEQIKVLLGHSTIRVTERYAHLGADSIHAKARATALPTAAHEGASGPTFREGVSAVVSSGWAGQGSNLRPTVCKTPPAPNDPESLAPFVGTAWATDRPEVRTLRDVALAALMSQAEGDEPTAVAAARELAELVLGRGDVRLALEVRDGGTFALRAARELARLVLSGDVDALERRRAE
jgi:integrase